LNISYEKNKKAKDILNKCIMLMKLKELLNKNLISLDEYEKIKKKFKFLKCVEKKELLCYNGLEITITNYKRREYVSSWSNWSKSR